ncbi:hypothetical protein QVA66_08120 [Staphylococcus chromogenes]|nr:hypothetical protein [Staphylococcus chromogenes]
MPSQSPPSGESAQPTKQASATKQPIEPQSHTAAAPASDKNSKRSAANKVIPVETLMSLQLPSLCGHQAGQLVNGELPKNLRTAPGAAPNANAKLVKHADGTPLGAYTDINGDGKDEAVVAYSCVLGGVSWPERVLIYDNDLNFLAEFKDWPEPHTPQRSHIRDIQWQENSVRITCAGWAKNDPAATASRQMQADLTTNDGQPVLTVVSDQPAR